MKIKREDNNFSDPPRRKIEKSINSLISLQTKVATLSKEADKQLDNPLIKLEDPTLKCQINSSESSESGQTEALVEAVFNETTLNKEFSRDMPRCAHDCLLKHYREKHGIQNLTGRAELGENSSFRTMNAPNEEKKFTFSQSYSLSQPANACICCQRTFEPSQLSYDSSEKQKVDLSMQNVKIKSNVNTRKETASKPQKHNVHWSKNLKEEYSKLASVNRLQSTSIDPKPITPIIKTHDVSINTDNPKVNAKCIHIVGKDVDDDKNKSLKKVFSIQELPGVNIRPQLTKQSCPNINIICSEKSSKTNNITMLKMYHGDERMDKEANDIQPTNIALNKPEHIVDPTADSQQPCINCRVRKRVDKNTCNCCNKKDKKNLFKNNSYKKKTKEKKTEIFDKDKLLKDIHFLKNITSHNKSFRDALKNIEYTIGELQKHFDFSGKKQWLDDSKQYHNSVLPKRLNVVAGLLQDAVQSFDTFDDQKVDNILGIIELLSHDIKCFMDKCKRKSETRLEMDTSDAGKTISDDSGSAPNIVKGHALEGATKSNIDYIPYRKLYPGKGAKAIEAAENETEKDLRLSRIKKFYEINRDLYNLSSSTNNGNSTNNVCKVEERDGNSARHLNETYIIENEVAVGGDDNKHDPPHLVDGVEYEDDWEEDDESEDEGSSHSFRNAQNNELKTNDAEIPASGEVKFQEDIVSTIEISSVQREKGPSEAETAECKLESKIPTNSANSARYEREKLEDKKEISVINEEKSKGLSENKSDEPNFNLEMNNKNIPYPFFKLTNPQTKSLVEIRFPEDHNTFKSSLTVSSCPDKDEIKLLYDKGNGQMCGTEVMSGSEVEQNFLKALDNKPVNKKEETASECLNGQLASGETNSNSIISFERVSANFMEFLEVKVRDFFNTYHQPSEGIRNKEIQTDKDEIVNEFNYEKVSDRISGRLSHQLPPYQSETISIKSSMHNSSEKISDPRETFTDLLIPSLDHIPLSVPQESLETNLSSNLFRNEVVHTPEVANFLVDKKVDNEEANYEYLQNSIETQPKRDNEQNLQRLLPLPQTVITDTTQNSEDISPQVGFPNENNIEDITVAEVQPDNGLILEEAARLFPLPSDINSLSDYNSHGYDSNRCSIHDVKFDSSSSNQTNDAEVHNANGIPTDILPSPSILNSFIGSCSVPTTQRLVRQAAPKDSDSDSLISTENFEIYYFNTDEMSEGEIGFVYTSNTYSSGEVKPRSSSNEGASSIGDSLSEDGKKCNRQIELSNRLSSSSTRNELRKHRTLRSEMNPVFTSSAFLNNSSDNDFLRSLRHLEILERNISLQSDSSTTESTTSDSSSCKT
ncbi:hypothetical protein O3M35_001027 [Rhynocoris fuscipes]|uniref:Uncharacterized protein n=1 Tax=Rhynocoris fuscipes TaxID=488301 RepID=A0AAW1DRX5_9HEMI